jgi:FtsH-binding integral membrane protein
MFSGVVGALVGIVIMGIVVFILLSSDRMDLMGVIMLACIAIIVIIGLIFYFVEKRKHVQPVPTPKK